MKYIKDEEWTVESFLNYVEEHSQTPRKLFNHSMVAEILHLNGESELAEEIYHGSKKWFSHDLRDYVNEIRAKEERKEQSIENFFPII